MNGKQEYLIGLDVGSTTSKIVILDRENENIVYSEYARHHAELARSVCLLLEHAREHIDAGAEVRIAFTGSGSRPLADAARVPFVQEVVANSLAVMKHYPTAKTAIELGGQDAKVIFFRSNSQTGRLEVADMRMNGMRLPRECLQLSVRFATQGSVTASTTVPTPRITAMSSAAFRKNCGRVVLALVGMKKVRR